MGSTNSLGLSEEEIGIIPRVINLIYEKLENEKQQKVFNIKISFIEIYNGNIKDLLDNNLPIRNLLWQGRRFGSNITIRETKSGSIQLLGAKEEVVTSKEEVLNLLERGILYRTTSSTLMNLQSSRSHAIFTISLVQQTEPCSPQIHSDGLNPEDCEQNGLENEFISSKFHFVDLAGSESIKKTGSTGETLKEGISINKGLLCLGNVITALTDQTKLNRHIPYRDTKLTRILQDSLGGNSRTYMIACISPAESNFQETLNTMKYASRGRNIKNKPIINLDPKSALISSLRKQIIGLKSKTSAMKSLLNKNNINFIDITPC